MEEQYAKALATRLKNELSDNCFIEYSGGGVHWSCDIKSRHGRSCQVWCLDIDYTNTAYKGPQYDVTFEEGLNGRLLSENTLVDAIKDWVGGISNDNLYQKYTFIDAVKRYLTSLLQQLTDTIPNLKKFCRIEWHGISRSVTLLIYSGHRHCRIYTYGFEEKPMCAFFWNGTKMFEIEILKQDSFSQLLDKWLCQNERPSVLKKLFPNTDFGKLVSYYEEGRGVEGEFILSWESVIDFYGKHPEVLDFINSLLPQNLQTKLRAGTSLYTLVLSRSRRHGLRVDQPSVGIDFYKFISGKTTLSLLDKHLAKARSDKKRQNIITKRREAREALSSDDIITVTHTLDGKRESFNTSITNSTDVLNLLNRLTKLPIS